MSDRLVALVDMDCFYCQVETRLNPTLKGKPMAVVQYNQWKGGGIIAVNYEARDRGVTRHMRGHEAKQHCPEIQLVSVPSVRGKADLTKYRDAGREVINIICEFSECVQRASVDEAYIDLTEAVEKRLASKAKVTAAQLENTFVVGYSSADNNDEDEREKGVKTWLEDVYSSVLLDPNLHRLALAAALVEEMRAAVFDKTGFRCSAGISHNKILAKLVCGVHKPNRQTVLPMVSLAELYRTLPVKKVRNLGGKLGNNVVETLGITHMGELANFSEKQLQAKYDDKTGTWLYNIARGIDLDPVTPRLVSKSIGCCKNFPGKTALGTKADVTHWLSELAAEVAERLDEDIHMNKRKAQLLTIHFSQEVGGKDTSMSRSVSLPGYEAEKIATCAFNILAKSSTTQQSDNIWYPPLKYLGLSAGKFVEYSGNSSGSIDKFFKAMPPAKSSSNTDNSDTSEMNALENVKLVSKSKDSKDEISESKIEDTPSVENDQTANKCHNRVSFFEQYFKNQPNKIVRKNSPIKSVKQETITKEKQSQSLVTAPPFSSSDNDSCSFKKDFTASNVITNYDKKESNDKASEDTWISASEIFPDLENIDESLVNILPSPLQKQISKLRKAKNNSLVESKVEENNISNSKFRLPTDLDCAPSTLDTVADIQNYSGNVNIASTSSMYSVHNRLLKTNKKSEDLMELEDEFIETSPDLFESETHKESRKETKSKMFGEYTDCKHCKESILVSELQEHLDHHMALQLQEQWEKESQQNRTVVPSVSKISKTTTVLSDKKKRGRPSKKDVIPPKKSKTIMSFFSKT